VVENRDISSLRRLQAFRLLLLLLLELLFLGAAWGGWRLYGGYLAEYMQDELTAIGQIAAYQIGVNGDKSSQHALLNTVSVNAGLENLFAVDTNGRSIGDARHGIKTGSRYSPVLLDPEAFATALEGRPAYGPKQNLAGFTFRSSYVPIKDQKGRKMGVVVAWAGEAYTDILARLQGVVRWFMAVAGIGLLAYLALFWIGERYAASVADEAQKSRGLALIGMLAAEVAHRIRNPLAIILTTSEALRMRYQKDWDHDAMLDYIPEEVHRVDAAVEQLLSLGRERPKNVSDFAISSAVSGALEIAGIDKRFPNVRVAEETLAEWSETTPEPNIRGDKASICEGLSNIIVNAAEAMKGSGTVTIRMLRTPAGEAEVTVSDVGPGIPKEMMSHLFDPFYTMRPSGAGLGLAIAGRIFEQHKAVVKVETGKGGTTFRMTFPPIPAEAPDEKLAEGDEHGKTADS